MVPRHRHTAVERNRLKRRLREVLRTEVVPRLDDGGRPLDVLVRARREAYGQEFQRLRGELVRWAETQC